VVEGAPTVRHTSVVAYRSGRRVASDAYRVLLDGRRKRQWKRVLDDAARPGDVQRTPVESLLMCAQMAQWHGQLALAAAAYARLFTRSDLPSNVKRGQLAGAVVTLRGLATWERAHARARRITTDALS
jgi:hypothetical protein